MLKFKQFINEILNPEQEADVATWAKRTIKATKATENDKDEYIRHDAVMHPNATAEVIRNAAKNDPHAVNRMRAASHLKNRFNEDV